jgi:hypothetical protein
LNRWGRFHLSIFDFRAIATFYIIIDGATTRPYKNGTIIQQLQADQTAQTAYLAGQEAF